MDLGHYCSSGSSPLVRGQLFLLAEGRNRFRIIPARAGPTGPAHVHGLPDADHPRSCGANRTPRPRSSTLTGSSPLVRGQLAWSGLLHSGLRIIPARAGPTKASSNSCATATDHPRSCGANAIGQAFQPVADGSSPLVRGQPLPHPLAGSVVRIIPARAGPTRQ